VPTITLFVPPAKVVPAILIVALVAGAEILPKAWRQAHWPSIRRLLAGAVFGTPVGVYALFTLPANLMRAIIGIIVFVAVLLLWRGIKFSKRPPTVAQLGIGAFSGLLNGGTAMGGPPVILYFLASPEVSSIGGVAIGRASLLVYFFFLSIWTIGMGAIGGLVDLRTLMFAVLMMPFMAIGNRIGDRLFDKSSARTYQRVALIFLFAISLLAIGRAVAG